MKKLVSLAIMFAAVAVLGTALSSAANNESSSTKAVAAKPAKQCCQNKGADTKTKVSESPKRACCLEAEKKATLVAKTQECSGESCSAGKQAAGKFKFCVTDVAAASNSKSQCASGDAGKCDGKCGGKCVLDAAETAVSPTKAGDKPCGSCKGACKQECSSCAEARNDTAEDNANLTTAKGNDVAPRMGRGHGHADDSQHAKDHQDFFYLIEHRDDIRRTVKNLPNGVETLTESEVEEVASMIQTHVEAMYDRLENANPIRMRDPIFREVFANAKKIKMDVERTDHGVRVKETSDDAYAVKLVQEHAKVVSLWIKNGYAELPKNHAAPKR